MSKRGHCAVEVDFDGAFRRFHHFGDLLDRQSLVILQDERGSLLRRQRLQCGVDSARDLSGEHLLVGRQRLGRIMRRLYLAFDGFVELIRRGALGAPFIV